MGCASWTSRGKKHSADSSVVIQPPPDNSSDPVLSGVGTSSFVISSPGLSSSPVNVQTGSVPCKAASHSIDPKEAEDSKYRINGAAVIAENVGNLQEETSTSPKDSSGIPKHQARASEEEGAEKGHLVSSSTATHNKELHPAMSAKDTDMKENGNGSIAESPVQGSATDKKVTAWEDASWWTDGSNNVAKAIPFLSYPLIEAATGKFCHPLGEGGYGKVFKGRIRRRENGETTTLDVAVKVLWNETFEAQAEFMAEMRAVHKMEHRNVVRLVAACTDQIKALIYEFVAGGDVEHLIWRCQRGEAKFPWLSRLKVALGCAEALEFIHQHDYIHRDFKAGNVLLDKDFNPKVADFGLAKGIVDWEKHISTRIMGTAGYIDPQYFLTGHLHVKSDVYSLGVFLVELLTTKLVSQDNIQDTLLPQLQRAEMLEIPALLAPEVLAEGRKKDAVCLAYIARHCLAKEWDARPLMPQVVVKLRKVVNDAVEYAQRKAAAKAAGGTTPGSSSEA